MSRTTMTISIIGIVLLIYGYLCRLLSIFFFWDSKHLGWLAIIVGLMSFLIDQKKSFIAQKRNVFIVRLLIGVIIFSLGIQGGAMFLLKSSKAYKDAITQIRDGQLKHEIGTLRGFGFFPSGFDVVNIAFHTKTGPARFVMTVRGSEAYRDVEVTLEKGSSITWELSSINPIYP